MCITNVDISDMLVSSPLQVEVVTLTAGEFVISEIVSLCVHFYLVLHLMFYNDFLNILDVRVWVRVGVLVYVRACVGTCIRTCMHAYTRAYMRGEMYALDS